MGGLLTAGQLLLGGSFIAFLLGLWVGYKLLPLVFDRTPAPVKDVLENFKQELVAHLEGEVAYMAAKLRATMGIVAPKPGPGVGQAAVLGTQGSAAGQVDVVATQASQASAPVLLPPNVVGPTAPGGGRTIG